MGVDQRGPVRRGALELVSEPGPRLRRERLRAACKVDEVAGVDGHGSNSGLLEVGDEFGRVARGRLTPSPGGRVVTEDLKGRGADLARPARRAHEAGAYSQVNSDAGSGGGPRQPPARFICYGAGHGAPRGTASRARPADDRAARLLPVADRDRRRAAVPPGRVPLTLDPRKGWAPPRVLRPSGYSPAAAGQAPSGLNH